MYEGDNPNCWLHVSLRVTSSFVCWAMLCDSLYTPQRLYKIHVSVIIFYDLFTISSPRTLVVALSLAVRIKISSTALVHVRKPSSWQLPGPRYRSQPHPWAEPRRKVTSPECWAMEMSISLNRQDPHRKVTSSFTVYVTMPTVCRTHSKESHHLDAGSSNMSQSHSVLRAQLWEDSHTT